MLLFLSLLFSIRSSYCHQPFSSSSRNVNIVEKLELRWAAVSRGVPWIITSCAQELQRPSFKMTRECFVLSIPSEPRKRWVKFCFHHFNNLNLGFSPCSANRYSLSCISERFSNECRKTKTKFKLTGRTNHKNTGHPVNQSKVKYLHVAGAKRGKTCAGKSRLVLVLVLIGQKNWPEVL